MTNLTEQFEALVTDVYAADEPGAAVLVKQGGKIVYAKGQGMANLEWQIPIEPDMVFRYASITKQFTAVAILILLEQGKLKLDDVITKHLPDYPVGDQPFTIRHLLTHTSGITSYTDMPSWLSLWRNDFTVAELVEFFQDEPRLFTPGEQFAYNNSGYILLGAIIEKLSGQTYAEFIQSQIFEPAGMETAVYDTPQQIIPRRVSGNSQSPAGYVNSEYVSMTQPYAAGSLAGTVYDLAAWDNILYTDKLLKQETLALAYKPFTLNNGELSHYGFGWSSMNYEGHHLVSHSGGIHGFSTHAIRDLSSQSFVVVLSNNDSKSPELLAFQLLAEALGKPLRAPEPIPVSKETVQSYTGQYIINEHMIRKIFVKDGTLFSQLGERPPIELIPVAEHLFVMGENILIKLKFLADENGRFHTIEQLNHDHIANRAKKAPN